MRMQISELERMRDWAAQRLSAGQEPPWDWYQLMKLREALAALIESEVQNATQPTEGRPESSEHSGSVLRLVVSTPAPNERR
jgi:hypothetical protein